MHDKAIEYTNQEILSSSDSLVSYFLPTRGLYPRWSPNLIYSSPYYVLLLCETYSVSIDYRKPGTTANIRFTHSRTKSSLTYTTCIIYECYNSVASSIVEFANLYQV